MAIKIDRFQVKNKQRGKATVLASFDVNLGPVTVRGYEIVRVPGDRGDFTFIAEPNNSYKDTQGDWKRFNFVVYNGAKGEALKAKIEEQALEELGRRQTAPVSAGGSSYDDDELGF